MPNTLPKIQLDKIATDKKLHFAALFGLTFIIMGLLKALGLKFYEFVIGTAIACAYIMVIKEIYDCKIFDILVPDSPYNYIVLVLFFTLACIVAWLYSIKKVSRNIALIISLPVGSIMVLMIFGAKVHATGFSTDDIIAGQLGYLAAMVIITVIYYFFRLIKYMKDGIEFEED